MDFYNMIKSLEFKLDNLQERVAALEEITSEQEETIRDLTVDTGQNSEEINNLKFEQDNYRCELDEISAEIDAHIQGHDRNP